MSIEALRQRALAASTAAPARFVKCFDPAAAERLDAARKQVETTVATLERIREDLGKSDRAGRPAKDVSLADVAPMNVATTAAQIVAADLEKAKAELATVEDGLPPDDTMVLKFRWIKPVLYEEILKKHQPSPSKMLAEDWLSGFGDELAETCFLGADSLTGQPTGLTWPELTEAVLNHGEMAEIRGLVISHNRDLRGVTFRP
ncbi:MAG: hypothetical protein LBL55_11400 [Propionibacteriaceae bacterium]|jgi:hypothetical protein|nr:hypothetical protein [Propionibacteriaceae bacterium]